jgi:hypothetical protein
MSFRDCISSALSQGAITKEEAADLVRRFEALEIAEGINPGKPGGTARAILTEELRAEGIERRRRELLQANATGKIYSDLRRFAMLNERSDVVGAAYRLFENFGDAGFASVRGLYAGLLGAAHSEMNDLLHQFRRSALTMRRFNRAGLDDIARAAFGETQVPAEAHGFYKAWLKPAEKLRALFNEAGGHIGWDKEWGMPTRHDAAALINAGFDKWRGFIEGRLDWDKMRHAISGREILPAEREDVLHHVWESVVMDGWNTREPSLQGGRPALYNRRADPRFLKFKDAESWLDYNKQFGSGDTFTTMMRHVQSMARDVALMQRLGPNPAATVRWLQQIIEQEGAKLKAGQPSLMKDISPTKVASSVAMAKWTLDGFYDVARGSSVPHSFASDAIGILRNVQYSAKLGGAVIMHALVNPVIQAGGRYMHGLPLTSMAMDLARGLKNKDEMTAAGLILQDALNTLERGARERGALMKLREISNWLPAVTTHYSGLDAIVNANRRAAFSAQMANFATQLDTHWSALPDRLKRVLEGYGMQESDWAIMREATPHEPEKGAKFLRWTDIADTGLDGSQETAQKYNAMLHMATEALVPSSNWRVRATTSRLGPEGTLAGEVVRSAMMFKGGFMATFMLSQFSMIRRELAAEGVGSAASYIGAMAIGMTIAGMGVLQLKSLRSGKDLLSVDPSSPEGRNTWMHSFLTSGALGIYGDFIQSDRSSYGHDLLSTIAGPMVTGAEDTWHEVKRLGDWAAKQAGLAKDTGKGPDPGTDSVKMLRNNTPVASTHWAVMAAYNRIVLDQLQYLTDRNAHASMRQRERAVAKDTGQGFWWRPGALAPERAPRFAIPH